MSAASTARRNLALIDFEAARIAVRDAARPVATERIALAEAHGRIAAAQVCATEPLAGFARAAMDGYALRSELTAGAARAALTLPVHGALAAGDRPSTLAAGAAMSIATGAPLPAGADAVVPWERVVRHGDSIELAAPLLAGDNVFPPGEDALPGELLVRRGERVTAGRAALLACAGIATLEVYRRPRVAIVCTGDELVDVAADPLPGQIHNSNATLLAALVARDGAELVRVPAAIEDREDALATTLRALLPASDLVLTTGGASAGPRDVVKRTLDKLDAHVIFDSVAMRPGKPTGFARVGEALVAVLPGNPAAAFAAYSTLVRGALHRLTGRRYVEPARLDAHLDGHLRAKDGRHVLVFAVLRYERDKGFIARPLASQSSALVRTSAQANAFIVLAPGNEEHERGAVVTVEPLDWEAVGFS